MEYNFDRSHPNIETIQYLNMQELSKLSCANKTYYHKLLKLLKEKREGLILERDAILLSLGFKVKSELISWSPRRSVSMVKRVEQYVANYGDYLLQSRRVELQNIVIRRHNQTPFLIKTVRYLDLTVALDGDGRINGLCLPRGGRIVCRKSVIPQRMQYMTAENSKFNLIVCYLIKHFNPEIISAHAVFGTTFIDELALFLLLERKRVSSCSLIAPPYLLFPDISSIETEVETDTVPHRCYDCVRKFFAR